MIAKVFTDLIVWQKAHEFVLSVYRLTRGFPKEELYGVTSQLRRAAVSIPANIAEGFRKAGVNDRARFLTIAQGSIEECRYYLILVRDLEYAATDEQSRLLEEVSKLTHAFRRSLMDV